MRLLVYAWFIWLIGYWLVGLFCGEDEGVGAGGDVDVVAKG